MWVRELLCLLRAETAERVESCFSPQQGVVPSFKSILMPSWPGFEAESSSPLGLTPVTWPSILLSHWLRSSTYPPSQLGSIQQQLQGTQECIASARSLHYTGEVCIRSKPWYLLLCLVIVDRTEYNAILSEGGFLFCSLGCLFDWPGVWVLYRRSIQTTE